jgi:hypothetical protein
LERDVLCKWMLKVSRSSSSHIWQSKISQKRQRRSLHMDKEHGPSKDITIVNLDTPKVFTPNFIKQTLLNK